MREYDVVYDEVITVEADSEDEARARADSLRDSMFGDRWLRVEVVEAQPHA